MLLCTLRHVWPDRCVHLAVVQFALTPVLAAKGFLPRLLSNVLYAVAFSYYHYLSFLGYSALPFLERTEVRPGLQLVSAESWSIPIQKDQQLLYLLICRLTGSPAKQQCLRAGMQDTQHAS